MNKLTAAGVTEPQAKIQVEAMQAVVDCYDKASRKNLATKGDIQNVRNELKLEIASTKHEIIKWLLVIAIGQTTVMAALIGIVIAILIK